jgi:hypothetical protein
MRKKAPVIGRGFLLDYWVLFRLPPFMGEVGAKRSMGVVALKAEPTPSAPLGHLPHK